MDPKDRVPSYAINTFDKGLWKDALPSLQPVGTYKEAWSVVNILAYLRLSSQIFPHNIDMDMN